MIAVKAEKDRLEIAIPTKGMLPEEISDFVSWLRVESVARRSKLTPDVDRGSQQALKNFVGGVQHGSLASGADESLYGSSVR